MENKISEEMALAQVEVFLDYYGIEKKDIEIEDGVEAVQTMFNTLTRAIRRGTLEIVNGDELEITHYLSNPIDDVTKITYKDRVGRAKIAMDSVSSKKLQLRQNIFMSAMGDVPESTLIKLKGFDSTVCSRLATVFSMV